MRRHLCIDVIEKTGAMYSFVATGETLMLWLKSAVDKESTKHKTPTGDGTTPEKPYVIDTYAQWARARVAFGEDGFRAKTCYLKVAGRVIVKHANKTSGGHADGCYMSDHQLSGKSGAKEGTIWYRESGASYREFAKHLLVKMKGSDSHKFDADAGVAWSQKKMEKLRLILTGKSPDLSTKGKDATAAALPLLAAVMFISEPARNPREFPIGLMVLDMIGQSYSAGSPGKFYTWDRVLAHPERVDPGYKGKDSLSKPQMGPTRDDRSTLVPLTTKSQLSFVEGKLPASPSGSASSAEAISLTTDYIQMKEASILARWLAWKLGKAARDGGTTYIFTAAPPEEHIGSRMLLNSPDEGLMKKAVGESGVARAKEVRAALELEVIALITRRSRQMGDV